MSDQRAALSTCRECRQYASHADWCSKFEHHPDCPAANYRGIPCVCGPK